MPKLAASVEKLDELPENVREFYVERKDPKDDSKVVFELDLEENVKSHSMVLALQNAHEAQKKINRDLKAEMATLKAKVDAIPDDFDADEFETLRETKKLYDELKAKNSDDPEKREAHLRELESVKQLHEKQLDKLRKAVETAKIEGASKEKELKDKIKQMIVGDSLSRLLIESGVKKEAVPFVAAKMERSVKVSEEDGQFKAYMETDLGEFPIDEYIKKWAESSDEAKLFVEQPRGGDALGGTRKGGTDSGGNPWTAAAWNMTRQAEIMKNDAAKADRLARAAGHKKASGALRMDAK